MGNGKPEALRKVENALWKALMNTALGADQGGQLNEFIQHTSDVVDIHDADVLHWFVKSTPDFHYVCVTISGPTLLRN
jgi:hypothetical protein